MGEIFYDKYIGKLVYDIVFPKKEIWVSKDTILYRFVNNKLIETKTAPAFAFLSIFRLALNNNLSNYGLDNSMFTLESVENKEETVVTSWQPPEKYKNLFGKIMLSQKAKHLQAIVFFNASDEIVSKLFFENYDNYSGLEFPARIVQFNYIDNVENYQITSFKQIYINENENDNWYNHPIY